MPNAPEDAPTLALLGLANAGSLSELILDDTMLGATTFHELQIR